MGSEIAPGYPAPVSKESLGSSAQLALLSLIQWPCVLGAVDAGLSLRGS